MNRSRIPALALAALVAVLGASRADAQAYNFTTLDYPGASRTYAYGISGSDIVGYWTDSSNYEHGFLHSGTDYNTGWSTIDNPNALSQVLHGEGTNLYGITGNLAVGVYNASGDTFHGFLYNTTTAAFTTIDYNAATGTTSGDKPTPLRNHGGTYTDGIFGNTVVGTYEDNNGFGMSHSFLYDITKDPTLASSYTVLPDYTKASTTLGGIAAYGISGSNIVGTYVDDNDVLNGFLYNSITQQYKTIDDGVFGTNIFGIDGSYISGSYIDSQGKDNGFLYNMASSTFTTIDDPLGSNFTQGEGNSDYKVVGYYNGSDGIAHGFLATTPEPGTLALFTGLGITGLSLFIHRRLRRN